MSLTFDTQPGRGLLGTSSTRRARPSGTGRAVDDRELPDGTTGVGHPESVARWHLIRPDP